MSTPPPAPTPTVVEVPQEGGVVDLTTAEEDAAFAAARRKAGNAHFTAGRYAEALADYDAGLARVPRDHLLLNNKSAALLKSGDAAGAKAAALACVESRPDYIKGYARLGTAELELGAPAAARQILDRALRLGGGAEDKNLMQLGKKVEKAEAAARAASGRRSQKANKVFGAVFQQEGGAAEALYGDRPDVLAADPEERQRAKNAQALEWIAGLLQMNDNGVPHLLSQGVFNRLFDKSTFAATAFPGLNAEQLKSAPRSLNELLEVPAYKEEIEERMPRVRAKADSVLANVKERGRQMGEIMTPETEELLWPSIMQEAFGRELVTAVRNVHSRLRNLMGRDPRLVADKDDEAATWDQLPDGLLGGLFRDLPNFAEGKEDDGAMPGTAVLDDFLGAEWLPLLKADIARMAEGDALANLVIPDIPGVEGGGQNVSGFQTSWLDEDSAKRHNYTGFQELLSALHALPHELNAKVGIKAARSLPGSSLLVHNDGSACAHVPRGSDAAPGCILSFLYVVGVDKPEDAPNPGGTIVLSDDALEAERRVELKADRLIAWRSHNVLHEREALGVGTSADAVYFWVYVADGEVVPQGAVPAAVPRPAPKPKPKPKATLGLFAAMGCTTGCACGRW
eukprot:CAMPEP_0118880700 /NCGR_PEP_ID=MMETSP1163-20130328/20245_1 /TAXON_ID=124430 /ORGANISM="Phaeomonas parva, Strain CCMP2877" /LENGTH=625 /DNA_ID=CAMNT_0006817207 /DNA_START=132 /DNA_END=2009 /DNA_ORIENTATION=+